MAPPEPPKLTVLPDPSTGHTNYPVENGTIDIDYIAIFPPLGISRVGNSDECFLAPEVPGHTSPPKDQKGKEYNFRDAQQNLRRQAVRFRVYAYGANNIVLGELNTKNGYTLKWTVHVANKKAAGHIFQRNGRFGPYNHTLRNPSVQPDEGLEKRDKLIIAANGTISPEDSEDHVNLQGEFKGSRKEEEPAVVVDLAQLQVDGAGRLVFIPGKGDGRSITEPDKPHPQVTSGFDSENWFDEVCDGTVTVEVTGKNLPARVPVVGARVLSGPPNFAWGINAPTTLYDVMENIYCEEGNQHVPAPSSSNLDFWTHIWPVLQSASSISWTNNSAFQGHSQFSTGHFDAQALLNLFNGNDMSTEKKEERQLFKTRIFEKLRKPLIDDKPDHTQADVRYMPLLSGDIGDMPDPGGFPLDLKPDARKFASLTKLQYKRFEIWKKDDDFHLTGDNPPVPHSKLEIFDIKQQPEQLTRAILESTTGDPCFPGIEAYGIVKSKKTYNTQKEAVTNPNPPFRIHESILPGHLTRGLSLPWQCDFDMCNTHWWPAVRPDHVVSKLIFENTVQQSKKKEDFNTAITARFKWKRGLRDTVSRSNYIGSEDMIKYWTHLGVVREIKIELDDGVETAFLEDERVGL